MFASEKHTQHKKQVPAGNIYLKMHPARQVFRHGRAHFPYGQEGDVRKSIIGVQCDNNIPSPKEKTMYVQLRRRYLRTTGAMNAVLRGSLI